MRAIIGIFTAKLLIGLLLLAALPVLAEQYRSRELLAPSTSSTKEQRSIAQLEQQLEQMQDVYSRESTARFLARHYLQKGQQQDLQKAVAYYRQALKDSGSEQGLSRFAKQEMLLELVNIHFFQKDYPDFLQVLARYKADGGEIDQPLQLKRARAFYEVGNTKRALSSTNIVFNALSPALDKAPSEVLDQLLFLFYQLKSYNAAAKVQQQLLSRDNSLPQWQRLSAIYRKAGNPGRAAETLLLAHKKQLALSQQQLQLISDLLAQAKNPYAAASHLQAFLSSGSITATVGLYERLFHYWYQAQETDKAIAALVKANTLKPDVSRYLTLAELHRTEQHWPEMMGMVLKACEKTLADEYVSRANLYLGIAALKTNDKNLARQAFINATLTGGRGEAANRYLQFMQAEKPSEDELSSFSGPCRPAWANNSGQSMDLGSGAGFSASSAEALEVSDEMLEFSVKTLEPQRFIVADHVLKVEQLEKKILPLAMKLGVFIIKNGGKINGPMHFNFPNPIAEDATTIHFQMAFPIKKPPRLKGRYKLIDESAFYTASYEFKGPPEQLIESWKRLYVAVVNKGHIPTGRSRQVVINAEKNRPDMLHMELQMQLQKNDG